MAETGDYDTVIGLGTVIRGATSHYDYVCNEAAKGIAKVSLDTNVPVIFGVLTTENIEQAIERAGTKAGNKGYESAVSAIEMANLKKCLNNDQINNARMLTFNIILAFVFVSKIKCIIRSL